MKKTMACFLAAIMTIMALPINIFAQPLPGDLTRNLSVGTGRVATSRLSRSPIVAPERTAFVEARPSLTDVSGTVTNSNLIDNWLEGSNLNIIWEETVANTGIPVEFVLELDNAQWFFRDASSGDTGNFNSPTYNPANGSWNATTNTYTRTGGTDYSYTLEVSRANPRRATVRITDRISTRASAGGGIEFAGEDTGGAQTVERDGVTTRPAPNPETVEATAFFNKKDKKKEEEEPIQKQENEQQEQDRKPGQSAGPISPNTEPKPGKDREPVISPKPAKTPAQSDNQPSQTVPPKKSDIPKPAGQVVPESPKVQPENKRTTRDAVLVDAMDPIDDYNREMGITNDEDGTQTDDLLNYDNGTMPSRAARQRSRITRSTNRSVPPEYQYIEDAMYAVIAAKEYIGYAIAAVNQPASHTVVIGYIEDAEEAVEAAEEYLYDEDTIAGVAAHLTASLGRLDAADTFIGTLSLTGTDVIPSGGNRTDLINYLNDANSPLALAEGLLSDALDYVVPGPGPGPTGGVNVREDEVVTIPIVARSTETDADITIRVIQSTPVPIQSHTLLFARGTGPGLTTTSIQRPSTGRDRIEVGPVGVFENRTGILPASGEFELVAPSGYHFSNITNATLHPEGGLRTGTGWNYDITYVANSDSRVVRVEYNNLVPSTTITGQLVVSNLILLSNNPDVAREGDILMTIRNVSGRPRIVTQQDFVAATISDWRVSLETLTDIPELINGRLVGTRMIDVSDTEHRAARVKVEEVIPNAWWSQRATTFTLPPEVRVRKVEFRNIRNVTNSTELNGSFYNERGRGGNTAAVRVNDNVITIAGLTVPQGERASFEMELWLNVQSGYEGDINLTLGGSALTTTSAPEAPTTRIATAINPVNINANLTNVRMGYDFVSVGDFTITETVAGALRQHEEMFVSVTDEFFAELHFAANFSARVTEGDLLIRNVRASNNLGFLQNNNLTWRTGTNAILEIDRESTKPSTIEFTNVAVRLSPNVPLPTTQNRYDLVAWGPAVAANFEGVREADDELVNRNDFFSNAPGIIEPYVNVTGTGTALNLTNIVRATANSPVLMVNDEQMLMDTAPFVSPISDSFMVPVRFISMALGIEAGRVMWSPSTSTVTVDAGDRIIQFTTNSSIMLVNGIELPMLNAMGNPVYTEVRDERAFIPFRALAEALNVYVEWDPATATATFDPTRPATRAFHLEDTMGAQAFFGDLYTDGYANDRNMTSRGVDQNNVLPRANIYNVYPGAGASYPGAHYYNGNSFNITNLPNRDNNTSIAGRPVNNNNQMENAS